MACASVPAHDTRLDRSVAIKVLSLSHSHICPLFDVGHHGGTDFLIMEYLDGKTLAQRLARGKLPLDQAREYGIQSADAENRP